VGEGVDLVNIVRKRDHVEPVTVLDVPALALACQALTIYEDAHAMVQSDGYFMEGASGALVKHPAVRVMDEASRQSLVQLRIGK
jgi:P27 family predicted phage terminase small subunit